MSEAKQLFMDVSLSVQKQSVDAVEALNTFRGPQGPQGSPGGIDNLMINGKKPTPADGMNTIDLTAADVGALPADGTAVNADKLNGKSADEYALKTDIPTSAGVTIKLLWSNADAQSDFAQQDGVLSEAVENFKYLILETNSATISKNKISSVHVVDDQGFNAMIIDRLYYRHIKIKGGTSVSFLDAYSDSEMVNNRVVPIAIYGVR